MQISKAFFGSRNLIGAILLVGLFSSSCGFLEGSDAGSGDGSGSESGDDVNEAFALLDGDNGEGGGNVDANLLPVNDLQLGRCFDDAVQDQGSYVNVVDCGLPHDNEVFLIGEVEDEENPGEAATLERATEACGVEFANFVGKPEAESAYSLFAFAPSDASWLEGDRLFICSIYEEGTKLQGSAKDSAR